MSEALNFTLVKYGECLPPTPPPKKKKVRTLILHSQWHFFLVTKRTINYTFFFPLCLCSLIFKSRTFYFCFRHTLVFDLLSLQNRYWSFDTVSGSSSTQTLPDLQPLPTHLFHRLQTIPFCHVPNCADLTHMGWVSSPSLPSQHRSCSSINFYWPEISTTHKQRTTKKSSVWLLWTCFMENRRHLMNKWVVISFEYPKYVALHNRLGKLKIQQLPLQNFCKSE